MCCLCHFSLLPSRCNYAKKLAYPRRTKKTYLMNIGICQYLLIDINMYTCILCFLCLFLHMRHFFFLLSLLPYLSINQAEYFEREANNAGASLTMQVMEKRWEMRADFMCQILQHEWERKCSTLAFCSNGITCHHR